MGPEQIADVFWTANLHKVGPGEYELSTYTEAEVEMIILLEDDPTYLDSFRKYCDNFNVDDQVELHRRDPRYRKDFSLRESLEDFEKFQKRINKVLQTLLERVIEGGIGG